MFDKTIYQQRRNTLRNQFAEGIILLLGNKEAPANYPDNTYHFRQDSTFLYFFGHSHPDMAGIIDVDGGIDTLYGNDVDIDDIIWMGPQPSIADKAAEIGTSYSGQLCDLQQAVAKAIGAGRKVYFLAPYRHANRLWLESLTGIHPAQQDMHASLKLVKAIIDLRMKKEPCEIEELDKAGDIGYLMHTTAMRMCRPGAKEQLLAGTLNGIAMAYGRMTSFTTILTQHGEIMHNHGYGGTLQSGRLLLVDAGAERMSGYCSDHTRTFPVSGKFEGRQKEIYEIVLACHDHALELARPGVTYKSVHLSVCKKLAQGLKDMGLMRGNIDEAVDAGAHALFLPHGLGHAMGLDVHDMENLGQQYVGFDDEVRPSSQFGLASLRMGRRLQPGFVMTDEPGCYFIPALIDQWKAQHKFEEYINYDALEAFKDFGGIRLEDDILITDEGSRFLGTKRIPIAPAEVEATINS